NATAQGLLWLINSTEIAPFYSAGSPNFIWLDSYASDHNNFKRFHVYAPYVETLEIYDRNSNWCYIVEDWYLLWDEIQAQDRPLLPNLKALRFVNTSPSHGLEELEWISLFATPKLKEVSLAPHMNSPSWPILFPIASRILQTLVDRCPSIQTLDLATDDDRHPENTNSARRRAGLAHRSSRPWYHELQHLTKLRHLTVSEGWLYPASLQVLGRLPELESLTIVPGSLKGFDYQSDMDRDLPNGAFPQLTKLSMVGLEGSGMGIILSVTGMSRQITRMKLEFDPEFMNDEHYEFKKLFKGLRHATCLRELHVSFPCDPEEGACPAEVNGSMERMGPHPSLEYVHLDGIRIPKDFRRAHRSIYGLAAIWPNVRTLTMPSQHASIRDLEDFATLPSLVHLTVKLNLEHPYLPEVSEFELAPLKRLTSSGPVRLGSVYKNLMRSAHQLNTFNPTTSALLSLYPLLEQVTWSDGDPARMQLAEFFNSEVLRFTREFLFGSPPKDARSSARKSAKEMKVPFRLIVEDLEEVASDSDSDSETEEGSGSG
ncbi:hypothetical protein FRC11_007560, partial [Ceratobasidium sp. 423]